LVAGAIARTLNLTQSRTTMDEPAVAQIWNVKTL
jgi:hypothetical protein